MVGILPPMLQTKGGMQMWNNEAGIKWMQHNKKKNKKTTIDF
jgi:hypothetical protein